MPSSGDPASDIQDELGRSRNGPQSIRVSLRRLFLNRGFDNVLTELGINDGRIPGRDGDVC